MATCTSATRGDTIPARLRAALEWPDDGNETAIVLFVRGPWCPVCRRQIARYAAVADEFAALRSRLYIVSTGRREAFLTDPQLGSLPVDYVADAGGEIVTSLGIAAEHPDYETIARPTTLVIDRTGQIHYAHTGLHPRDRPEPAAILLAVRRLT